MTYPSRVSPHVVRESDYRRMPWRNGGGSTLEVARSPRQDAGRDFDWRVSIATVERDGAFSSLPGVRRTIALLDGPWMELSIDDAPAHRLAPLQPFDFSGDSQVAAHVPAPTRDLNLMTRAGRATGTIRVVRPAAGADAVDACGADLLLVVALQDELKLSVDQEPVVLHRYDSALCEPAQPVTLTGVAAVIRIRHGV